jgi:hypothetical protein
MMTNAANFILALLEERPIAASQILRDSGCAKDLNVQGIQKRLGEAIERKELQAQFDLANGILTESLRIEFQSQDCEALSGCMVSFNDAPKLTKIAEEAFEMGRRAVEGIVELHATKLASDLSQIEKPKFLEVHTV